MSITAPVDICNLALDYLGQGPVTNIDNPTMKEEVIMGRWYDVTRRICLREYVWNFAKKRAVLAPSSYVPGFDFTKAFTMPSECIRILSVGAEVETQSSVDYDIEGREICVKDDGTNQLKIVYIQDVTDVNKFDSLFINILSLRLALKVSYKFSLKPSVLKMINEHLSADELKAVTVDGQERPPKRIQRSKYLDARNGFRFSNTADIFTRWS